jgi:hypothetical protein
MGAAVRHRHDWRVTSSVPDAGCVIACACGAIVRVLRSGVGLRAEVLTTSFTYSTDDGWAIVRLAVPLIGPR